MNACVPLKMQASQKRGHAFVIAHYLTVMWIELMRDSHTWVGVFVPDTIGKIGSGVTRPQRVLALCLVMMANMASSAISMGLSDDGKAYCMRDYRVASRSKSLCVKLPLRLSVACFELHVIVQLSTSRQE